MELLFKRVQAANEQIVMVADHLAPEVDGNEIVQNALDEFAAALDRGVEISILGSSELIETAPDNLLTRLTHNPFTNENFTVRTADYLHGTVY
jgi:phosphatidylserine/phosphatidylglycerophosphate/cardiolipin synthase-like enzyme